MAIPSLTHSYGSLTSKENAVVDDAISNIPGCTIQLAARAIVRVGNLYSTGALALVREHSTNGFSLKLIDTTEGNVLWDHALSLRSDFRNEADQSQSYSLTDGETGLTATIIFYDGQVNDAARLQENVSRACRRLSKRLSKLATGFNTGTDDSITSSPEEMNDHLPIQIAETPTTYQAISAPAVPKWSEILSGPKVANEKRRETAPPVMDPIHTANNYSDGLVSGRSGGDEKVECWLECMEPVTCSAPPKLEARFSTDESVRLIDEDQASSYPHLPCARRPEQGAIRDVQHSSRRIRRRGPWTATINGRKFEIADVTTELTAYLAQPEDGGGFGFIRRGKLRGQDVAIKQIKPSAEHTFSNKIRMKETKRFQREVVIAMLCASMKHPNIVQFMGVAISEQLGACLVFPWMKNGNSLDYVRKNQTVPRRPLIRGILKALEYLHRHHFIHGDIKAHNVLISEEGEPLLTDFGLATHEDFDGEQLSLSIARAGNARWKAPELQEDSCAKKTKMSDMWAFGMFAIEILTANLPFPMAKRSASVQWDVHNNNLPPRPTHRECSDILWIIIEQCWGRVPEDRISAADALRLLENDGRWLSQVL